MSEGADWYYGETKTSTTNTGGALDNAGTSTLAVAMMFGSILFAATGLAARSYLAGETKSWQKLQEYTQQCGRGGGSSKSFSFSLYSFESVYAFLYHLSIFGIILFYAYLCERHPPFPHSSKTYDRDEFLFLIIILIGASLYSFGPNSKSSSSSTTTTTMHHHRMNNNNNDGNHANEVAPVQEHSNVLNRHQTEEWKGWMQIVFLLYHYFHAQEVYNTVRILITCYVWMTGFGNFSFFYLKGDYGTVRLLQMLWRLNFGVLFLCLTLGTTYILYYICLLHTFYFLMVFAIMRIGQDLNYSKWGLRTKLCCAALVIALVWDFDFGLFKVLHMPFLGTKPTLGATFGSLWEWYFRSSLDHWSAFLGMLFALNYPITSLFFRKLESQPQPWQGLAKGTVALALSGAFYVWFTGPFQQGKLDYNQTHAYFGFIPLLTYIYLRNLTPWLRSHSLHLLHQIGKTSLETYLFQHHIWLTSNAKSLLTLIPGYPKCNLFIVTLLYYIMARRVHYLTLYFRRVVLPTGNKSQCLSNLLVLGSVVALFHALAYSLQVIGWMSLASLGIVCVVLGLLLYHFVMDMTWEGFKQAALDHRQPTLEETMLEKMVGVGAGQPQYDTPLKALAAPTFGFLVVLIMGIAWHGMAQVGGIPLGKLSPRCAPAVNRGTWVPVMACNDEALGMAHRTHAVSSFATCAAGTDNTFVWGWNEAYSSSLHCRFTQRTMKQLREALDKKTVTFVGDSMTRHLYHATLRQMGMAGAGAYNAKIPKWSDISNSIGDTLVEFEWAALATDQVTKIKDIVTRAQKENGGSSSRPDLLVMGGGAWDRLHVYATDEDRESHRSTVKELAKEIRNTITNAGIPIVWLVPTTINTKALLTEEKQKNIKEQDMAGMRALYDSLGVTSAATFVLDGPSFTEQRVDESYDGVHYPLSVYDAGAQILANALDWILDEKGTTKTRKEEEQGKGAAPPLGSLSNPPLGMMMLCFIFMGLVCFDGFMGFSYLASFFVRGVMPSDLCDEAFEELHDRVDLPEQSGYVPASSDSTTTAATSRPSTARSVESSVRSSSKSSSKSSSRSARSGRTNESSGRSSRSGTRTSSQSRSGASATGHSSTGGGSGKGSSTGSIDDEIQALLGTTSKRLERTVEAGTL